MTTHAETPVGQDEGLLGGSVIQAHLTTQAALPSNVVDFAMRSRRKCAARIANGRRIGRGCVNVGTHYSPSRQEFFCGQHRPADAVDGGSGPHWSDDQVRHAVRFERCSDGNVRAVDCHGKLVAIVLDAGDRWRAFPISDIVLGSSGDRFGQGPSPLAAVESLGFIVSGEHL